MFGGVQRCQERGHHRGPARRRNPVPHALVFTAAVGHGSEFALGQDPPFLQSSAGPGIFGHDPGGGHGPGADLSGCLGDRRCFP